MEPLAAMQLLHELGTGRWGEWAIVWACRFTRLLVDVEFTRHSAEFVSFNHMSGGRANRRMQQPTASWANRIALFTRKEVQATARIAAVTCLTWSMVRLNVIRSIGTTRLIPDRLR